MPYTLKKNKFKYKNPDTGNYEGVDVVAERSFADYQSALENVGLQQQTAVRSEGTTQKNSVTAAGTAAAANFPATAAACDVLVGDFAATYVPDQAYAVGDYCTYQYQLYQCKTAIAANTDHTFVTSHWNLITVTDTINDQVDDLKTQLDDRGAYDRTDNLLNTGKLVTGLLNTDGVIVSNESYYTSDFIPVDGAKTLMFQAESSSIPVTNDTIYFCAYDADHIKVGSRSSFTIAKGGKSGTFETISDSTVFIRVSYVYARYTDVMIHIGESIETYAPFYALKSGIAHSGDVAALGEEVEECAKLPIVYTPIETTVNQGVIRTNKEIYNPSESYEGRYISIPVSADEVYSISGYSLNSYYPCAFVRTKTSVETLLGGTNTAFSDTVITIPKNFDTLYVNGNITQQSPIIKGPSRITQAEFEELMSDVVDSSNAQYPIKCLYKNGILYVKKKYNATRDIVISFGNVGGNSLFNFNSAFLIANNEDAPNNDFDGANAIVSWGMSGSDWIGPYTVAADQNADGDAPTNEYFTGGNHRTTNTGTGGGVTATQNSLEILVDGVNEIQTNTIYTCDSVNVKWQNTVQAYNTSKTDGTGRGVLTENWEMAINKNAIKVHNTITALENITLKTYYGLQATCSDKSYRYIGGTNRSVYAIGTDTERSGNNTCRTAEIFDQNFHLNITVDPVDLGLFTNNTGWSFFVSGTKLYASLVSSDHSLTILSGEKYDLEGAYCFK